MKLRYLLLTAAVCLTGSCQTTGPGRYVSTAPPTAELYADYLSASYANETSDRPARQSFYTQSFDAAPTDIRIGRRAIVSAIENDDFAAAIDLSKRVYAQSPTEAMARGVLGAEAFRRGQNSKALDYFAGPSDDFTMTLLMSLVRGWVEVEKGEIDAARTRFSDLEGARYFGAYGQLQLAKLELMEGNYGAADTALGKAETAGLSPVETALTRARLRSAQGETQAAVDGLQSLLADNRGFALGPVGKYAELLETGQALPEFTAQTQAARALTDPAYGFFARQGSQDGAELYLRFARHLAPDYGKASVWLAALLEEGEEPEQRRAQTLLQEVGPSDFYYVSAQLSLADLYFRWEEDDQAVSTLEALNARENSLLTRESLGRARFFRENYAEALPFYNAIVESLSDDDLKENVTPLRFRGIIHERLDMWPQAEADFKRVLDYAPDDVDTLNYLGYTWVDRGENLDEAFEMIRRAVEAQPESGAIVDSLGWAHYKLGEYQLAKDKLEDAVALSPSSATIIDHLGDAYWKLGRKREAGFQWKRALEFDPTEEERATILIKLESGLDAVPTAQ